MSAVCPSWLSFILYNPVRKYLTDRKRVMEESGITADSVVLEVGAGNGFFTEEIAGRARKVVAVELQEGMVRKLRKRVRPFGDKVEIILSDIAALQAPEETFDVCLLYFSFHEVADRQTGAETISRAIREGGILSIYEPSVEVNRSMMEETAALFEGLGFKREMERHGVFCRFLRMRKVHE